MEAATLARWARQGRALPGRPGHAPQAVRGRQGGDRRILDSGTPNICLNLSCLPRAQYCGSAYARNHCTVEALVLLTTVLFQHRHTQQLWCRYSYRGVIVGWDPLCAMPESWIVQMDVDALPGVDLPP